MATMATNINTTDGAVLGIETQPETRPLPPSQADIPSGDLDLDGEKRSLSPRSESESSIFETRKHNTTAKPAVATNIKDTATAKGLVSARSDPKSSPLIANTKPPMSNTDQEKTGAEPWEQTKKSIKSKDISKDEALKLHKFVEALPQVYKKVDNPEYDEVFGHRVNVDGLEHVDENVRNEILLKFLVAREFDLEKAQEMLINSLNWRNEFRPLLAAFEETFDEELNELGVLTYFSDSSKDNLKVTTWNLYGNMKNPKKLFAKFAQDTDIGTETRPGSQFLRWRVGLMERAICLMDFTDASNNKGAQVHDYNNVSMFRIDKDMKAATKQIISIFGDNYPELLSIKFFLNVNILMSWVFSFFKNLGIISAETLKKFEVSHNSDIGSYFGPERLPPQYNGQKNKTVASLFDIDYKKAAITPYGAVLLQKLNKKTIEDVNLTVD